MKSFRIVIGTLAIIPLALLMDNLLHPANYGPGTLGELLYLIFGVPILIFNMWIWVDPEIIESYYSGKQQDKL